MSRVVAQFSCGAASAVATKMALSQHKGSEVVIVNAFLKEEDDDNRRFLADCEDWFAQKAVQLRDEKYGASADEVWRRKNYMKGPHGAPCSGELKRKVLDWQADAARRRPGQGHRLHPETPRRAPRFGGDVRTHHQSRAFAGSRIPEPAAG